MREPWVTTLDSLTCDAIWDEASLECFLIQNLRHSIPCDGIDTLPHFSLSSRSLPTLPPMGCYLLKRFLSLLLVFFCVISATFVMMRLAPGSPFDSERHLPPAVEKQLMMKYKLDGSLWQQYVRYWQDLLQGDLRISTKYRNRTVNEILAQSLPNTLILGSLAFALAYLSGILFGILSAIRCRHFSDFFIVCSSLVALSCPAFVSGPLWILVFSLWLGWLPPGGWGGMTCLILPVITLSAPYAAYITHLMRTSMLDTLGQNFIRTARAKGLSTQQIISQQALKVAILPIISYLGPLAANLLTGSIVVESIFYLPGIGRFFVNSILNGDTFLLGGVVLIYCALLVIFNFVIDLAYPFFDPRIQYQT